MSNASMLLGLLLQAVAGNTDAYAGDDYFALEREQAVAKDQSTAFAREARGMQQPASFYTNYAWTYACTLTYPGPIKSDECGINLGSCEAPGEVLWRLWGQRSNGAWVALNDRACFGEDEDPATPTAAAPVITPAMVLNEIRRIGLPDPELTTEPPGSTLVNLETRFKTTDEAFTAEVTLLGRPVSLRATPTSYVVSHGDGTSGSTSDGSQNDGDVLVHTHFYTASGTVSPQVTTTWAASFSVAGGPMTDIAETITVASPATTLDVRSSTPLLVGND